MAPGAGANSTDRSGWLCLKGGGVLKRWKRRFVVLDGVVLTYFATADAEQPKGSVLVLSVDCNPKKDQQLQIQCVENTKSTTSIKSLQIKIDKETTEPRYWNICLFNWYKLFKKNSSHHSNHTESSPDQNTMKTVSVDSSRTNINTTGATVFYSGWLYDVFSNGESRCYFTLNDRYLSFEKMSPQGRVTQTIGKVICVVIIDTKYRFSMVIRFEDSRRRLTVFTTSEKELQEWFFAIYSAINGGTFVKEDVSKYSSLVSELMLSTTSNRRECLDSNCQ